MKHFVLGSIAGMVVTLLAAVLALWVLWSHYGEEIYWEWTVFQMPPACEEHEYPFLDDDYDPYRQINGVPTDEFWQFAIDYLEDYKDFDTPEWPSVSLKQGKIFVALREFFASSMLTGDLERHEDPDKIFFLLSSYAAKEIYEDREARGLLTEEVLKPYWIFRWERGIKFPPHPDECGFMEELIQKGGRFASE